MSVIDDILAEKDFEKIRKETETNYREYLNPLKEIRVQEAGHK